MAIVAVSLATVGTSGLVMATGISLTYLAAFGRLSWFRIHAKETWKIAWVLFGVSLFLPAMQGGCRNRALEITAFPPGSNTTTTPIVTEDGEEPITEDEQATATTTDDSTSTDDLNAIPGWAVAWMTLMMSTTAWGGFVTEREPPLTTIVWFTSLTIANICLLSAPFWLSRRWKRLQSMAVMLYAITIAATWSVDVALHNSSSDESSSLVFRLQYGYYVWAGAHLVLFLAAPLSRRHWMVIVCAALTWIALIAAGTFS